MSNSTSVMSSKVKPSGPYCFKRSTPEATNTKCPPNL
jgi:hypothetical protein